MIFPSIFPFTIVRLIAFERCISLCTYFLPRSKNNFTIWVWCREWSFVVVVVLRFGDLFSQTLRDEWKFQNVLRFFFCIAHESLFEGETESKVIFKASMITAVALHMNVECVSVDDATTAAHTSRKSRYYFPYHRSLTHHVSPTFPWSLTENRHTCFIYTPFFFLTHSNARSVYSGVCREARVKKKAQENNC